MTQKKKSTIHQSVFFLLTVLIYFTCTILFIYLMLDVWEKFQKKITSIGVGNQEDDVHEKALPCLSICPWRVFRNRGFHYTNDTYYNQTYNLSEIVFENELSYFEKQEIKSFVLGRCHMLCYQKKLPEINRTIITLRKAMDLMGKQCYQIRQFFQPFWQHC